MKHLISAWRFSLRELLLMFAFVALGCVSLLNASAMWATLVFSTTCLLFVWIGIASAVDRERRQAAALGGAIAMLAYGVLWTFEPEVDLDYAWEEKIGMHRVIVYPGYLPTSQGLNNLWERWSATYLVEDGTGKIAKRDSSIYTTPITATVPNSKYPPGWTGGPLVYKGLPEPAHFLAIGHCLFAMLFGYLGGKLAVWVYRRRVARESAAEEA